MSETDSDKKKKSSKMTNPGFYKPVSPILTLPGQPPAHMLDAGLDATSHSRELVPEDLLGHRIRQKREEKRLTQEALSILCRERDPNKKGISRPSIVAYENGDTLPGARELRLLSDALEVTPSWIILGEYDSPQEVDIESELSRFIYKVARGAARDVLHEFLAHNKEMEQLDALLDEAAHRMSLEQAAADAAKKETQKRNKKVAQKDIDS